ncbi:DUF4274 domain-containing protein [Symmachiella dynata]|uniref:DUF4274 domain-containing protein n=1 Tax=Symmachiella dynata TaxID=2527995 RepID=UPI00119DD188|nr:DUF4274 domain-containing protein [Symmachiella dynata]
MAKRIRKKARVYRKRTKAEHASPEFRDRSERKKAVLWRSYNLGKKLSKKRWQFISDIANGEWVYRLTGPKEARDELIERESPKWDKMLTAFLKEATDPLELHFFSCHWNYDRGVSPMLKIVKNEHCDAGTALNLYWRFDPYSFQNHRTLAECQNDEDRETFRILRTIERRFKRDDFATKRFPFDPTPWIEDDLAESAIHKIPAIMREPIIARRSRVVQKK